MDYCTAGPQYASGGFIADSKAGTVINGSQQQWLIRNSSIGGWSNGVWNQVFAGVAGRPGAALPEPAVHDAWPTTPVSREKPYLYVDADGGYNVFVPGRAARTRPAPPGRTARPRARSIPLSDFFLAKPADSVATINAQLAAGQEPAASRRACTTSTRASRSTAPDTVVLGMGIATLTAVNGAGPAGGRRRQGRRSSPAS